MAKVAPFCSAPWPLFTPPLTAMAMIAPCIWITNKIGKRSAWALSAGLFSLCPVLIGVIIVTGDRGLFALALLYVFKLIHGFMTSLKHVSMNSYLADIIDYDRWKSGEAHNGAYYSLRSFVEKVGMATLGPSIALAIVGWYGFSPADPVIDDGVRFGFLLTMGIIPAIFGVATCILILFIPINEQRSRAIARRLATRAVHGGDKAFSPTF